MVKRYFNTGGYELIFSAFHKGKSKRDREKIERRQASPLLLGCSPCLRLVYVLQRNQVLTTSKASTKTKDLLQQEQKQEQAARLAAAEAAIFSANFDDQDENPTPQDSQESLPQSIPVSINTISSQQADFNTAFSKKTGLGDINYDAQATASCTAETTDTLFPNETTLDTINVNNANIVKSAPVVKKTRATKIIRLKSKNEITASTSSYVSPENTSITVEKHSAAAASIFSSKDQEKINATVSASTTPQANTARANTNNGVENDISSRLTVADTALFSSEDQEEKIDATVSAPTEPQAKTTTDSVNDDAPSNRLAADDALLSYGKQKSAESMPPISKVDVDADLPPAPTNLPPDPKLGIPSSNLPFELQIAQRHLARWVLSCYGEYLTNEERSYLIDYVEQGAPFVKLIQDLVANIIIRANQDPNEPDPNFAHAYNKDMLINTESFDPDSSDLNGFNSKNIAPIADELQHKDIESLEGINDLEAKEGTACAEFIDQTLQKPLPPPSLPIQPEDPTPELQAKINELIQQDEHFDFSIDNPNATCSQLALLSLKEFAHVMNINEQLESMDVALFDTPDLMGFQNMVSAVRIRAISAEIAATKAQETAATSQQAAAIETTAPEEKAQIEVHTPRIFISRLAPEERPQPPQIEPEAKPDAKKVKVTRRKTKVVNKVAATTRTTVDTNGNDVTSTIETPVRKTRRKKNTDLNENEIKAAAFSAIFGDDYDDDNME